MKRILLPVVILAAASTAQLRAIDPPGVPKAIHVREVAPAEAKVGDILAAYGDNLNVDRVRELYLTDGKSDFKVEILEQADHKIRFRLPAWVPIGRLRVVVFNEEDMMLEQPAFVKVIPFPGSPYTG